MDFFNKLNKAKGGYIFLSHSHNDIEKVREIRNTLEKDGFEPLCFYLKCLDDKNSKEEVKNLIIREIDAREWFVFINSENSRKSKWVTFEREHITKTDSKKIITVDIDDEQDIAKAIYKISHNLRVFMSYANADIKLARRIKERLEDKDYLVFFAPDSIPAGANFMEIISTSIVEASKDGCVITLLTPNSLKSEGVKHEIMYALKIGGNIIPVMIGDVELSDEMMCYMSGQQVYKLSENPTDDEINEMIEKIGQNIVK